MPVFVTSKSSVNRHGVFAIERQPSAVIRVIGTGIACMVAQLPWGRDSEVVIPAGPKEAINEFAPGGMDHTGSGYLGMIQKSFPELDIVRVLGLSPVKAVATLPNAVPTSILTLALKYYGEAGNSVIATVSAASDADANHFNLGVSVSGLSGSTTDTLQNLNYSGTGADSAPDLSATLLLGAITKLVAGRPANGTYTFTTGASGTINAAAYVGTPNTGDKGIARVEGSKRVRHIFVDDPGNSLRAAVNSGLQAHTSLMGDRVAYINGDSGLSLSATQTDVANYRSTRVVYVDPWVYILDESGTKRAVGAASFAASVASRLEPSTSIAWKSDEVGDMLQGIKGLVSDRGNGAGSNTDAGIVTVIAEDEGGFRFEADPVTISPQNPAKKSLRRIRVGDGIAVSFVRSTRGFVDGSNVPVNHQSIMNALDDLLSTLKKAKDKDPEHNFHIKDYSGPVVGSSNTEIQAGELEINTEVVVASAMEKVFLGIAYSESQQLTITVT